MPFYSVTSASSLLRFRSYDSHPDDPETDPNYHKRCPGRRVVGRRPLGDMVDVPGWCDPRIEPTNSSGSDSASIPRSMPQIPTAQEVGEVEWCPEQDDDPDVRNVYSLAEARVPMEHVPQLAGMCYKAR